MELLERHWGRTTSGVGAIAVGFGVVLDYAVPSMRDLAALLVFAGSMAAFFGHIAWRLASRRQ